MAYSYDMPHAVIALMACYGVCYGTSHALIYLIIKVIDVANDDRPNLIARVLGIKNAFKKLA